MKKLVILVALLLSGCGDSGQGKDAKAYTVRSGMDPVTAREIDFQDRRYIVLQSYQGGLFVIDNGAVPAEASKK